MPNLWLIIPPDFPLSLFPFIFPNFLPSLGCLGALTEQSKVLKVILHQPSIFDDQLISISLFLGHHGIIVFQ